MIEPSTTSPEDTIAAVAQMKLSDAAMSAIRDTAQVMHDIFALYLDLEIIEIDYIKPSPEASVAYLSSLPRAWLREDGVITNYVPEDDELGIVNYLYEIGVKLGPLPHSIYQSIQPFVSEQQRFSIAFAPSCMIVRCLPGPQNENQSESYGRVLVVAGQSDRSEIGMARVHAQVHTFSEMMSFIVSKGYEISRLTSDR